MSFFLAYALDWTNKFLWQLEVGMSALDEDYHLYISFETCSIGDKYHEMRRKSPVAGTCAELSMVHWHIACLTEDCLASVSAMCNMIAAL